MKEAFFEELLSFGIRFSSLSSTLLATARPESLTPMQFEILQILFTGERTTLSELCGCTKLSMSNASRDVKKLVERGLVEKRNDPQDKRVHWLVLSGAGAELMEGAFGTLRGIFRERYQGLPDEAAAEMIRCISYLKERL